jgi:hypothetical protein
VRQLPIKEPGSRFLSERASNLRQELAKMSSPPQPLLDCAEVILGCVDGLIDSVQGPITKAKQLRFAFFLTIAEQFGAALLLSRAGAGIHGATHVRSMIEATITMNLLGKEGDHVNHLLLKSRKSEAELYDKLKNIPSLNSTDREKIEQRLSECMCAIATLKTKGAKSTHVTKNFETAGVSHLAAPYGFFCGFSHNDVSFVDRRHITDDGMVYRGPVDSQTLHQIILPALEIMVSATSAISEIGLFPPGLFEHVFQQMNNAWGAYVRFTETSMSRVNP